METNMALPEWFTDAFAEAGFTDMSVVCDWAHSMFARYEITVEVFSYIRNDKTYYRLFATDCGDVYTAKNGIVWDGAGLSKFLANVELEVEKLNN